MMSVFGKLRSLQTAGLVAVLALAACARRERAETGAATSPPVTDDWNRIVALAAPARRIVSLSPASTELVFALGLGDRLVGRTTWCDYPDSARQVPDVGNGIGPNVEAIAARRPDLVLLYASEANRAAQQQLARMGIGVAVLSLDLAADVRRAARTIGALAGAQAAADSLLIRFDTALAEASRLSDSSDTRTPVRAYVDVQGNPPITIGAGSYLSEIVAAAGALNVFDDIRGGSGNVSLEAIARRDPDVILVLASDTSKAPRLEQRAGWRTIRAVRENRVLVLDGRLYGRPSPRMPQAVRDLAERLQRVRGGSD
jgi:iron complex transport system substrate-binding protein